MISLPLLGAMKDYSIVPCSAAANAVLPKVLYVHITMYGLGHSSF